MPTGARGKRRRGRGGGRRLQRRRGQRQRQQQRWQQQRRARRHRGNRVACRRGRTAGAATAATVRRKVGKEKASPVSRAAFDLWQGVTARDPILAYENDRV